MSSFPSQLSLIDYIQYLPHQEKSECCTASSTLLAIEIMMAMNHRRIFFSRLYLYYMTRKLQNRLDKRGAELRETLRALALYGVCSESRWPFSSHRIDLEPGLNEMQEASHYKLQSYDIISINDWKEYLNKGIPVIFGMLTGKRFKFIKGKLEDQQYWPINDTDNKLSLGHAMTCIGYNDNLNDGSWIVANSYGPKWGQNGYAAIPYKCNSDIIESYAIIEFAGIPMDKKFPIIDK
jgi:C1A family cysteine protease